MSKHELLLIESVKRHNCLYNKTNNDFRNRQKRDKAWERVSAECGWPVKQCQCRWKTLRDRFVRVYKYNDPRSYGYYDQLSFLLEHIKPRSTNDLDCSRLFLDIQDGNQVAYVVEELHPNSSSELDRAKSENSSDKNDVMIIEDDDVVNCTNEEDGVVNCANAEDGVANCVNDDYVTNCAKDDDVMTCANENYVTTCVNDDDVKTCVNEEDDVPIPVNDDDVTICANEDYVTTCVDEDNVTTCANENYVAACVNEDDVKTCVNEEDDVTISVNEDDVTISVNEDDVATCVNEEDALSDAPSDTIQKSVFEAKSEFFRVLGKLESVLEKKTNEDHSQCGSQVDGMQDPFYKYLHSILSRVDESARIDLQLDILNFANTQVRDAKRSRTS